MAAYKHEGKSVDYTPGADVAMDDAIDMQLGMVGIAHLDIPANQLGALGIDGVYELVKATAADVMAFGDPVTITPGSPAQVTNVAGPHRVVKASANGDPTVWVKINLGMPTV